MSTSRAIFASLWLSLGPGWALPAFAHHAFTAQYDSEQPVSIEGVVVKIEWLNPHAYFYVDVKDEATGKIASWACELGSPVVLTRQGWSRNTLRIGDLVSVDGIRSRDGTAALNAKSVVLTDTGARLFTRSAGEQRQVDRAKSAAGREP